MSASDDLYQQQLRAALNKVALDAGSGDLDSQLLLERLSQEQTRQLRLSAIRAHAQVNGYPDTLRGRTEAMNDLFGLDGCREVKTPVGNIDVLTASEVIEVKHIKLWKSALGQVLVYGSYHPKLQKRIHLYGKHGHLTLSEIKDHCSNFQVSVTWES